MAIFGNDTQGTDTFPTSGGRCLVSPHTLTEDAQANFLRIAFDAGTSAGCNAKALLFEDDGAGAPGNLVASTTAVAIPAGGGWVEFPFTETMAPGDYWIGFVTDSFQATVNGVSHTNGLLRAEGYSYASPGNWPGAAAAASPMWLSAYIDYDVPQGPISATVGMSFDATAAIAGKGALSAEVSLVFGMTATGPAPLGAISAAVSLALDATGAIHHDARRSASLSMTFNVAGDMAPPSFYPETAILLGETEYLTAAGMSGVNAAEAWTLQGLVYLEGGQPTWTSYNRIFEHLFASRVAAFGTNNTFGDYHIRMHNNQAIPVGVMTPDPLGGKWYLATMRADANEGAAGIFEVIMQGLDEVDAQLYHSQDKGEFFGSAASSTINVHGSSTSTGFPAGTRFQWIRGYDSYHDDTAVAADRLNDDPTGALFWWEFDDDGSGGVQITDLTGNGFLPTANGGTLAAGPGADEVDPDVAMRFFFLFGV